MYMKNDEILVELLGNKYTRAILSLTSGMECSAIQLCRELEIPLSTVYRKLKHLEHIGMVKHVKTIINLSGNEEKYYRCMIEEVKVTFNKGMLSVNLKIEECDDKIVRLWTRFALPEVQNINRFNGQTELQDL